MPSRGKRFKGKQRNNSRNKTSRSKTKRNKTLNLYKLKSEEQENVRKRRLRNDDVPNLKSKVQKIQNLESELDKDSSSSDEDHMNQLLNTFTSDPNNKKSIAIDSDDSIGDEHCDNEVEIKEPEYSEDGISHEELSNIEQSESDDEIDDKAINRAESSLVNSYVNDTGLNNAEELPDDNDEIDIEDLEEDENNQLDVADPFAMHLFFEISDTLLTSVQSIPMMIEHHTIEWPQLGKLNVQIPKCKIKESKTSNCTVLEKTQYAPQGTLPLLMKRNDKMFNSLHIKTQIINNISNANKNTSDIINAEFPLTPLQNEMFCIINNYQDLLYTQRSFENAEEIRFVYTLHMVNHILKTRSKVLHHNARLSKKDDVPESFRDQGLVRPKILVVVPFRHSAYQIISILIELLLPEDKGNVMHKARFIEEFTGHELVMPKKNPKPEDYEMLFTGNTGDDFKIGISVTKKSLKLFADFYSSDIIIASPLGLRTIIGSEGEGERDFDFLASIELLILDQTEIFLMQNWDHLLHIINHLHLQPKESHGTDFSRVRTWSLNGWAKYYRQTLIFSAFVLPEINSIFNKKCFNYFGKVKTSSMIAAGSICQVIVQLSHVFHKFTANDISQLSEKRFKFFIEKILPLQKENLMKQTLIFVSNYFDYVKLRNYFKKEDINFVQICEYSKEGKVARARDMFFHGDAHFLIYTERYHFFNRIRVKGIRHLVFYQPPNFPHFYYEMCNLMQESNMNKKVGNVSNMTVTVLYSKYDVNQLSAIVGTDRAAKMVQSDRNVYMLVTDGK